MPISGKFIRRTLRNVVFPARPYFVHLALTHRCNMRCRFCHIQDSKFEELDTEEMKRIVDILDRMGVAVLSVSGGGEPLIRADFAEIIDHAAGRGMYTKLTSNGTMPLARYEQLLRSGIQEIAISLDGVRGNDIPYSHTGPKILAAIRYLHDHLPPGKQLTINVTVSEANRDQVDEIVAYCAREFPRAKVWLNPVVVGNGSLRTGTEKKVSPHYLRRCESPTLLSAEFYKRGVEEQYRKDVYDWGCLAGRMFFDIKPNGDLWPCQDQPSRTGLNVLDPDFRRKLRRTDFSYRKECTGCTYSCYYVTQNGLRPKNWPDMAHLWWKSNTNPGDRCREVAQRYGWVAGLASFVLARLSLKPALTALAILLLAAGALEAADVPVSADAVVERMERANAARQERLQSWTSVRRYVAGNARLRRRAEATVEMHYSAPGEKAFRILGHSGSKVILSRVIQPILATERDTARPEVRAGTDISRRNYEFKLLEFDWGSASYVFAVQPKTRSRYLFRGKVWIDADSYGIRKIEGEPAQSPSFWVKRTLFRHDYGRFGDYWFPVSHHTEVELWIFGRSTLDVEYGDYRWEEAGQSTVDWISCLPEGAFCRQPPPCRWRPACRPSPTPRGARASSGRAS